MSAAAVADINKYKFSVCVFFLSFTFVLLRLQCRSFLLVLFSASSREYERRTKKRIR